MSATNWYMLPPVIPSEIPGSGYHKPDIGPIHDRPITREQWEFQRDFHEHLGRGMKEAFEMVAAGLRRESPLAAMFQTALPQPEGQP